MINSYEKEKLSSLLKDFYVAIGMRISVFDDQFRLITEYPQHPPELCAMIRSTEKGFAACKKCDEEAFLRARKMHTTDIRPGFVDTAMAKGEGLFWVTPVDKAVKQIKKAISDRKKVAFISKRWKYVAWLFKLIPSALYCKM